MYLIGINLIDSNLQSSLKIVVLTLNKKGCVVRITTNL